MQLNSACIVICAPMVKAYHLEPQKQTKDQLRSKIIIRWGNNGSEQANVGDQGCYSNLSDYLEQR